MASSPREAAAAALFALVNTAAESVAGLVTSSRVLKIYDQVDAVAMPALYQTQRSETNERGPLGLPSKRTMRFEIFLYVSDAQEQSVVPSTQLNTMVDAIQRALEQGNPVTGIQNLGGACVSARVDGNIEFHENVTGDGKSISIIPIAVLLP